MAYLQRLSSVSGLHDIEIEKLVLVTSGVKIFTLLIEHTAAVVAGTNVLSIILL